MHGTEPASKATCAARGKLRFAAAALVYLALTLGLGLSAGAQSPSTAGQLLVAGESMRDPRFRETVIYMVEHDASGALGLVVNRPLGAAPVAALMERLGLDAEQARGEIAMYLGGPVEPGRGFVLHSADVMDEDSQEISPGVAIGASEKMLRQIGRGEGPKHSLFAFGYAGWGPGQLDGELARDDWFTIPAAPEAVFAEDPAQTWRRAMQKRGIDL
jgi:putative transcriptional regulator